MIHVVLDCDIPSHSLEGLVVATTNFRQHFAEPDYKGQPLVV